MNKPIQQTITLVHAGMSITSPIPVIIWMVTCHDQAMSERLLVEVSSFVVFTF